MSGHRDFSTHSRRSRRGAWELGLVIAGLVAFVLAAHAAWNAQAALAGARSRVEALRREADIDRARVQALEAGPGVGERLASQALLTAEAEPPRVIADLVAIMPADVRLEALSLTYGERLDLDLQVTARGSSAYDLFLKRLTESPRMRNVAPGAENRQGEVRASVRASYAPASLP